MPHSNPESKSLATGLTPTRFLSARPVWLPGREQEMNLTVGFRAAFAAPRTGPGEHVLLRVAASSLYRAFLNGEFIGHGPARGPHGFYRLDEWDLTGRFRPGRNVLALEVVGYNVNSYYLLDQPAFLQAEVIAEKRVLAATAARGRGFAAHVVDERVQKSQRYSYQRTFMEVWRPRRGFNAWRTDPKVAVRTERLTEVEPKRLIPRAVPYPTFALRNPVASAASGRTRTVPLAAKPWMDRSLTGVGPVLKGYRQDEMPIVPSLELQTFVTRSMRNLAQPWQPDQTIKLTAGAFRILDFGTNLTGFPGLTVTTHGRARLYLIFDELLIDGDIDFKRSSCVNAILYELPAGVFQLESFEPYTLRYLKLFVVEGDCKISAPYLRENAHPGNPVAQFTCSDERLNRLFAAGRETFRQNSVDLFMDCPSRERAGWLCDSFFTARAAADLCGDTRVERTFLENFLLPRKFPHMPNGMLPMCYPADQPNGLFIPNWALWFVIQLEEYLARSGDRVMIDTFRPKVMALFDYFKPFLNSNGLLEKLKSWVFVEWSEANKFVQDVNFPTNMLYAGALEAAARLYRLPRLAAQAQRVHATIRRLSFDGDFFADNAVRENGRLKITQNRSEVCQYFAFFFGTATPRSHKRLWRRLCNDFGPGRAKTGAFPDVHPSAPFIGNVLRLELLSRWGLARQILDESVDYLLYMADRTGTLWEMADDRASCNHGFASHVCHLLYRDVLGVRHLDRPGRTIRLRINDLGIDWCRGTLPVPGGTVTVEWRRQERRILHRAEAPAGYTFKIACAQSVMQSRRVRRVL